MKQTLAPLGLAALVCLPCLLVVGAAGVAASGALVAFVHEPLVKGAALLVLLVAAALTWRWWRQRTCEIDRSTAGAGEKAASRRAPAPPHD